MNPLSLIGWREEGKGTQRILGDRDVRGQAGRREKVGGEEDTLGDRGRGDREQGGPSWTGLRRGDEGETIKDIREAMGDSRAYRGTREQTTVK